MPSRAVGVVPASRVKLVLFSRLPTILLLAVLESVIRLWELADAELWTLPLPREYEGLLRPDGELFWSLRPNLSLTFKGVTVNTNSLGLRSAEVEEKQPREFRILSMGESSTFGVGVEDHATYSSILERYLRRNYRTRFSQTFMGTEVLHLRKKGSG